MKSIEQLENDYWTEPNEFTSGLVATCHMYRKIPIDELTIEQLRLLISQKVGLKHIIEIGISELDKNILAEGDFYEGDLLMAISNVQSEFWNENKTEFLTFKNIVERNSELIKFELGEKKFDRINTNIKASVQQCV
ncbi:hypothetical protein FBALC1_08383 [Flavobacteriales bacterium ALC-1]|nr:hypothetical protein FBALC1_08383 [Flavobacteriales bacterium ALC-1]